MKPDLNRRNFLGSAAATAAAFTIVPRHVLGGPNYVAPSDKITLAHVGFGTEAIREVGSLLENPSVQLTAVCDVEKDGANYLEWTENGVRDFVRRLLDEPNWRAGKDRVPGGRDVGKEIIETYYAKKRASDKFTGVNTYVDFREMLEKEKDLDGVKIITPDHLHAAVAIAAMRKGKHVIGHKPLANRLAEGRLMIEVARQTKVKTHFMPANVSMGVRRVADWIKEGAIGQLREIHNWSTRPVWPQYLARPTNRPPIPKDFDWDLWLGPVPDLPYHPWYTHTTFRGWYDFGGGAIADMGIYANWPIFQTFDLDAPYSVETNISYACHVVEKSVCRRIPNDFSYPLASTARMRFPAKGERPALDLFWYDGGMKPQTPEELRADDRDLANEGMMFVGDRGKILGTFYCEDPRLIPESKFAEFRKARNLAPPAALKDYHFGGPGTGNRVVTGSGRSNDSTPWVEAVKGGPASYGDFLLGQPITEAFNLVSISYRLGGQKLLWDTASGKITNVPEANQYLTRDYRPGWELKSEG